VVGWKEKRGSCLPRKWEQCLVPDDQPEILLVCPQRAWTGEQKREDGETDAMRCKRAKPNMKHKMNLNIHLILN
jgi:hypothetical protein